MGGINRIPRGYLNMLGSQTGGKNPFDAGEVVNPVVEMTPFYHADRMSIETVTAVEAGLPQNFVTAVPNDESWMLYGIGFSRLIILAGDFVQWQFYLRRLPNTGANQNFAPLWAPPPTQAVGKVTPASLVDAIYFNNPVPLQAGSEIIGTVVQTNVFRTSFLTYIIARLES